MLNVSQILAYISLYISIQQQKSAFSDINLELFCQSWGTKEAVRRQKTVGRTLGLALTSYGEYHEIVSDHNLMSPLPLKALRRSIEEERSVSSDYSDFFPAD